jgi:membrane fusion protein (multidrug efflux system)
VQLGYTNGELAEVKSGVREGDRVVTAGKVAIRDGTEIQVIDAAGAKHDSKALVAGAVTK